MFVVVRRACKPVTGPRHSVQTLLFRLATLNLVSLNTGQSTAFHFFFRQQTLSRPYELSRQPTLPRPFVRIKKKQRQREGCCGRQSCSRVPACGWSPHPSSTVPPKARGMAEHRFSSPPGGTALGLLTPRVWREPGAVTGPSANAPGFAGALLQVGHAAVETTPRATFGPLPD